MLEARQISREDLGSILSVLVHEAPKYGVSASINDNELVIHVPNRWLYLDQYEDGPARLLTYTYSAHVLVTYNSTSALCWTEDALSKICTQRLL